MVLGRSEEGFNFEESFPPEVREGRGSVTEGPSHLDRSPLGDLKRKMGSLTKMALGICFSFKCLSPES